MASALAPLKSLTADDIKISEKGSKKQGKVSTYVLEVTNKDHEYSKWGELKVMLYTDKKETRVMSVSSTAGTYTLDVMYQGPKIDIPNYDNFSESDNQITLNSDRSDGLVALYQYNKTIDENQPVDETEIVYAKTINPLAVADFKVEEDGITYTYKITTVESAVNWNYEYTEINIRIVGIDKDGNEVIYSGEDPNGYVGHYFVQTKNILKTKKDMSSMIPMAAAIVALIALLVALLALFKIKKQNKELTSKIKALSGETDEEEIIIDAEVETTENVEENTAEIAKITDAVDAKVENVTIEEDSAEKTE